MQVQRSLVAQKVSKVQNPHWRKVKIEKFLPIGATTPNICTCMHGCWCTYGWQCGLYQISCRVRLTLTLLLVRDLEPDVASKPYDRAFAVGVFSFGQKHFHIHIFVDVVITVPHRHTGDMTCLAASIIIAAE